MAKARATCTCKTCGATFERTADKRNRAECDSWEQWAVENITECPSCYGRRMRDAERSTPVHVELTVTPYTKEFNFILRGNTYPFKDTAKQMGFRWMEEPISGALGFLATKAPRKAWVYTCKEDGLNSISEKISSAGLEVKSSISGLDLLVMADSKKQEQDGGDA